MNITNADRINQSSVIEAFIDNVTERTGYLHRAEAKPDDHPYDYWLQYYSPHTKEWMTDCMVEIKCRTKRYRTLKISKSKMSKVFNFSQRYGVHFFLLVWFQEEPEVIYVLHVKDLDWPSCVVVNRVNGRSEEEGVEIPLFSFDRKIPIDAEFQHSANSDPVSV